MNFIEDNSQNDEDEEDNDYTYNIYNFQRLENQVFRKTNEKKAVQCSDWTYTIPQANLKEISDESDEDLSGSQFDISEDDDVDQTFD